MRRLSPALLVLLSCTVLQAQKRLAIIGSSTSACFGATVYDSCYVERLDHYYNRLAPFDTLIDNSFAVPGYTCYRGMPSSYISPYSDMPPDPAHDITAALASHPDVILVNYPSNGYDYLPSDSILYCLRTIRDSASNAGVPCFVTTTQPRTSGNFALPAIKYKMAVLKDSILAEFGYFAIDFYTGLYNPADSSLLYDAGDQTHMNNIGHDSLFQRVLRKNIFNTPAQALPASFLQWHAVHNGNGTLIEWITARETDVASYEVQRSTDAQRFSTIAVLPAVNAEGSTRYSYTDAAPVKGWVYYRVMLADRDGKKHASPVMNVYINPGRLSVTRAFARSSCQVQVELQDNAGEKVSLELFNHTGMIISRGSGKTTTGNTRLYLDTPLLASGIYYIKITSPRNSAVSAFIKN